MSPFVLSKVQCPQTYLRVQCPLASLEGGTAPDWLATNLMLAIAQMQSFTEPSMMCYVPDLL
jgi:hypothetical protein